MAFKLGNRPLPGIAREGNINKKHKFKVERKKLAPGINGEAFPGKVVVDKSITPGSAKDKIVISHEGQHVKDMASGKAAFGDDWVRWEGKTYQRKDGKIKYNGKWKDEGDHSFPWEKSAMKAESPLKHAPEESHLNREKPLKDSEGNVHHHRKTESGWVTMMLGHNQGGHEEAKQISDEKAKELAGGEMTPQRKALLENINKNRREEGLPEFKTLEEAKK